MSVHSYSYEGIYRCAHFWMDRGHTVVVILRTISEKRFPIHGWEYLEELEKIAKTDKSLCVIVRQKVRRIQETDENGERRPKYYKPYDD